MSYLGWIRGTGCSPTISLKKNSQVSFSLLFRSETTTKKRHYFRSQYSQAALAFEFDLSRSWSSSGVGRFAGRISSSLWSEVIGTEDFSIFDHSGSEEAKS